MKSKILDILYKNEGGSVSGQELSRILGVSRTAVWKHINSLISEGYKIKSLGGKGYTLTSSDILNEYELEKVLGSDIPFIFAKTVGSTNNLAKDKARETKNEFMLVTAENQKAGRGRMGRSFESDNKKGVWCSFILKPEMTPESALVITVAAATAVCKSLEQTCGLKAGIKWPNDIIHNKKKVCGILSEMSCETGVIEYIIVGIGINVSHKEGDFSPEVSKTATSVLAETGLSTHRAEIISSLCYNMQEVYNLVKAGAMDEIAQRWKKYSVTDGKMIKILRNNSEIKALAEGIDEKGRLVATDEKGNKAAYNSGEISIRGIMGYI